MRLPDFAYLAASGPCAAAAAVRYARTGKPVAQWRAKVTGRTDVPPASGPRVWVHAVSVGEVLQVRPLLRELQAARPGVDVVLSASTASGLKLAAETFPDVSVVPFPFDFSWAARRALDAIRPDAVCLVELELWPNFLAEAEARGVPVVVANGRLSERSFRGYRRAGRLLRPTFGRLTHVAAQNPVYAGRFEDLGSPSVSVTGSMKFDGLRFDRDRPEVRELRDALGFESGDRVLVAGSTHEPEEAVALDAYEEVRAARPEARLLIVPRHPERFGAVRSLIASRGHAVWSRTGGGEDRRAVRLLDSVGELSAAWALADAAMVGGTLCDRGGQNMLEPAAYGVPVLMGPDTRNFAEIAAGLLDCGAAETVRNAGEVAAAVGRFWSDAAAERRVGDAAKAFAGSQRGAAERTAAVITGLLPTAVRSSRRSA